MGAATASAQSPEDEAKAEYKLGEDLEASGKLAESCEHYRKALGLVRVSGPLRKSAQCDAREGKIREALGKYDELLAMLGADNPKRAEYQAEQKELAGKLAKVTLTPRPGTPGAISATLDGAPVALSTPLDADPGAHRLRVTAAGDTTERTLTLTPGQQLQLEVPFEAPTPGLPPLRVAGIVALGLAGAAAVGIAVTGGLVYVAKDDTEVACGANAQSAACDDEIAHGNTLLTANLALWIVGGVAAATGTTLLIVDAVGSKPAGSSGVTSAQISFGLGAIAVSGNLW